MFIQNKEAILFSHNVQNDFSDMVPAMYIMEEFIHAGELNELYLDYPVIRTVILLSLYEKDVGRT